MTFYIASQPGLSHSDVFQLMALTSLSRHKVHLRSSYTGKLVENGLNLAIMLIKSNFDFGGGHGSRVEAIHS